MSAPKVLYMDNDARDLPKPEEQQMIRDKYGLEAILADPADPIGSGLRKWREEPGFVLALVDGCLPAGSSLAAGELKRFEHVGRLLELNPNAQVVVHSGALTPEDRERARQMGAAACVKKGEPLDPYYEEAARQAGHGRASDADFDWAMTDPEVRRRNGGQVVAVHARRVWGAGTDHLDALRSAQSQPGCPPKKAISFVVVPYYVAEVGSEFAWCLTDENRKRYGGKVVVAYRGRALGAGPNREAAWRRAQADPDCPAPKDVAYIRIPESRRVAERAGSLPA